MKKNPVRFAFKALKWLLSAATFLTVFAMYFNFVTIMDKTPTTAVKIWAPENVRFVSESDFWSLVERSSSATMMRSFDAFQSAFTDRTITACILKDRVNYAVKLEGNVVIRSYSCFDTDEAMAQNPTKAFLRGRDWAVIVGQPTGDFMNVLLCALIGIVGIMGALLLTFFLWTFTPSHWLEEWSGDKEDQNPLVGQPA